MEQIDYTDQKPWSPITFGRALALAENEHEQFRLWLQVNSNHREISTMEIDTEKPTYSEPCPLQIGFGAEKPIPYTLKKIGAKTLKKNSAVDRNYEVRFNADAPEQGARLSDLH